MTTTKVTFKSLAVELGVDETELQSLLDSKKLDPSNLTNVQKDSIKAKLTKTISMKSNTEKPSENKLALQGTLPDNASSNSGKAVNTVETAKDRREVAAATVMTSGQDAVSMVLEKATTKANQKIADKLESLSDTLADQMALEMEAEILKTVDFFGQMLTKGTDRNLAVLGQVLEGEIIEA